MKTNEINWTADQSMPAIAGRALRNGRYIANHPQAGECVDFGTLRVDGKKRRLIVKLEGRTELQELVDAAIAAEAEAERCEAERMTKNVPGLAELQAAIDAEQQHRRDFNRMMDDEDNDGVHPPKHPTASSADLAEKYPRAAAYVRAENHSFASHWAKAKAGKESMEIIASGGSIEDAEAKLDNWLSDNNVYVD
jgi:hypothetical protein